MDAKKDVWVLRNLLNLTQSELAKELDVSYETINRWELGKNEIEPYNLEKIYSFAFRKKIYLNQIYEQLLKEEESENSKVLLHGCKRDFSLPADLNHSRTNNDFGVGFYLGENLKQAATYVSNSPSPRVFVFKINPEKLKAKRFDVSKEWMLAIAYYRGWIDKYKDHGLIKNVIKNVESADVVITPIADNKMFDLVSEFVRGEITDLQATHALAATNLGMQYVLRTPRALENIIFLDSLYISSIEKESLVNERLNMNAVCQDKVKVARINYRGKGQYIDQLLA